MNANTGPMPSECPPLIVARAVQPFHLPAFGVRGRLVRLGVLADALLGRHDHPQPVGRLAGKALALAGALGSALKFQGSFSVQAKGDGPVSLLVADCTDEGALRCYARAEPGAVAALDPASDATLLGEGVLAFTLDPGEAMERHQGIVAIEGDDLGEMAEHYFATSAQVPCLVRLAADRKDGAWRAGALMLERVAAGGGHDDGADEDAAPLAAAEGWRSAAALAATVTAGELLDEALTHEALLWRLFHETEIRVGPAQTLRFGCRCSTERLRAILGRFSAADLDAMSEGAEIVMRCEFCNHDCRIPRAGLAEDYSRE